MYKFFILVKKEIKELLTPQTLVPLLAVVLVFVFIGKVVGKQTAKSQAKPTVALLDLDRTSQSKIAMQAAGSMVGFDELSDQNAQQALTLAKSRGEKYLLVIPQGFGTGIENLHPQTLQVYTIINSFVSAGSRGDQQVTAALAAINEAVSKQLIGKNMPGANAQEIKNPITVQNFVQVGSNQAEIGPSAIAGFISSQTYFIPIVLFLVIVFASQMIANSIATEKENKTLETLLAAPVGRNTIVAAKLVGAGLVALLTAAVYLVGMRSYINGLTGSAMGTTAASNAALAQLGLSFGTVDYVLLGLSLFFGILAALSVAMILASFAEDSKSAQGIMTPLMLLVMIPYFLTMFLDINSLSSTARWLVYAIPFAHPFLAAPHLMLHQYTPVLWGILYMALFFLLFVFLASRIFSSDKILTMRLKLKKTAN